MNITIVNLAEAGYRPYPAGAGREVWQKTFKNAKGEKVYFLEFEFLQPPSESLFASTRFYLWSGIGGSHPSPIRVEINVAPMTTLGTVEQFFADMCQNLDALPDPHNND